MSEAALKIAVKLVKLFEGCKLTAYPDPASPLVKGTGTSGNPWTIGYGQTKNITEGLTWTQEKADSDVEATVSKFMDDVLKASPSLAKESAERIAAVTSFCYNIGMANYKTSTVCKKIATQEFMAAADAFLLWNKAQGIVMPGLVRRRREERALFLSTTGG